MNCFTKIWFPSFRFPSLHQCENQPLKVLFNPKLWRIKTQFFFVLNLKPHMNYLHGSLMYYSNTLSTKKWKKRWGRTEIDDTQSLLLTRKESDLDGYSSCFLILSLSDINSCAHHIVCSHGLPKKAGKRPLEEKIWSKTLVCIGIIRITHNSRIKSYQNQFAVIGHLPGPWGFWTLTLLQSLFATNLAVSFPARKALRETETDKYVKAVFCFGDGKSEKQISAHENVKSRDGGWRNGCVSSLIAPLRWRVWLSSHQRSGLHKHTFHRFLHFWMFWKRKICHRQTNVQ